MLMFLDCVTIEKSLCRIEIERVGKKHDLFCDKYPTFIL